ncbi:hypothetical protein [Kaarinaea lacus]
MTEKSLQKGVSEDTANSEFCHFPERRAGHFCTAGDPGIVVDMEIQMGEPVDSQIIRNFMGEFEQAKNKRSA